MPLKFDYSLRRQEGDHESIYRPGVIPQKLDNLTYIEGPNSSGKSTLLHLVAAGFHGAYSDDMDPALKAKVETMVDPDHQGTTFHIDLQTADESLQLIASKRDEKSREVKVEEHKNGKKRSLSADAFHRNYRLIYDIPADPTERMLQSVDEVLRVQDRYASKVTGLRQQIDGVIQEIKGARDPAKIDSMKKALDQQRERIKDQNEQLDDARATAELLAQFAASRKLSVQRRNRDSFAEELEGIKRGRAADEGNRKKISKQHSQALSKLGDLCEEMDDAKAALEPVLDRFVPKGQRDAFEAWQEMHFSRALQTLQFPSIAPALVADFRTVLADAKGSPEYKSDIEQAEVFDSLFNALQQFTYWNEPLPGTDVTIQQLMSSLEEAREAKKASLLAAKQFDHAAEHLKTIHDGFSKAKPLFEALRSASRDAMEVADDGDEDPERERMLGLDSRIKALEGSIENLEQDLVRLKLNPKKVDDHLAELKEEPLLQVYTSYSDEDLQAARAEHVDKRDNLERTVRQLDRAIAQGEAEVERQEKREPHPYHDRLDDLDHLKKVCAGMERKLKKTFGVYGARLSKGQKLDDSDEARRYAKALGTYLAARLGPFRHVQDTYQPTFVDMEAGAITTSDEHVFRLRDMGTGQSQSAYLMSLLSSEDERPIIALFDEVAMMDSKSIGPVYERMKQLESEGRLLLGIVVQKADEVKVEPLRSIV